MPKFPYKILGALFNRNFRNDLNQNFSDIESDIKELGAGQLQAIEAANEAETQAIYAQEQGDYANEKGTFASDQGTYAQNQADRAATEADRAAEEADRVALVADENKTRFLPALAAIADRDTVYPTPTHGDTIRVTGESKTYRYDRASGWVVTDQYNPTAIDQLNADLAEKVKKGNNVNNATSSSEPFLEISSGGASAGLHLTNSEGFTAPYILGIGKDFAGKGIELPNKANGNMITGTQRATVTDPNTYFMQLTQLSTTSPLVRLEQNVADAAPALQLLAFGTPSADQRLLYVGSPTGEAGRIFASDGRIRWKRDIEIQDKDSGVVNKLKLYSQEGVAENQRHHLMLDKQSVEWFNFSGSAGVWFPFQMRANGGTLNFSAGGTTNTVGTATYTNLISLQNTKIGFFGATPVTKRTGVAVTAEAIHAALVSLGLISA